MLFLSWKNSNVGKKKHKKNSQRDQRANENQNRKKDSKKMSHGGYSGGNGWSGQYGNGNGGAGYTLPANSKFNCAHTPEKGCAVGKWTLYPTADKYMNRKVLECFDVVCPLLDTAPYGLDYNEFCGLLMWIPIKDMTAPDYMRLRVNAQRIVDLMKAGNNIAMWCIGSHGRTGLVLATCIGIVEPDVDPIDTVRSRHCEHAVETQAQIEVVFKALDRPLPDKWKPKPIVTEPRAIPSYVQKGGYWKNDDAGRHVVTSKYVTCTYCKMIGTYNDVIHWFGAIGAHMDCYNKAVDAADKLKAKEKAEADANKQLVLASQPTTEMATVDTGKFVMDGTEVIEFDPTDPITDEDYRALVRSNRPINKRWSDEERTKLVGIENELDCFGDVICFDCNRLIIDPTSIVFAMFNGISMLTHKNCPDWKTNVKCDVLCGYCYDNEADADGFCSTQCELMATFEKGKNNDVLFQQYQKQQSDKNTQADLNPTRTKTTDR